MSPPTNAFVSLVSHCDRGTCHPRPVFLLSPGSVCAAGGEAASAAKPGGAGPGPRASPAHLPRARAGHGASARRGPRPHREHRHLGFYPSHTDLGRTAHGTVQRDSRGRSLRAPGPSLDTLKNKCPPPHQHGATKPLSSFLSLHLGSLYFVLGGGRRCEK